MHDSGPPPPPVQRDRSKGLPGNHLRKGLRVSNYLLDCLARLGHPRVLVVGDAILDRYIWGDAERVSQEAPVILLRADRDEVRLGGAANVAHMLVGLEARATLATIVGRDAAGSILRDDLERAQIDAGAVLLDPGRPTTIKGRF